MHYSAGGWTQGLVACWVSTLSLYTTCLNWSFVSRVFHLPVYIRHNHSQTIDSGSCSPRSRCFYTPFRSTANRNSLCLALKASPGITSIQARRFRDFSGSFLLLSFHTDSLLKRPTPHSPAIHIAHIPPSGFAFSKKLPWPHFCFCFFFSSSFYSFKCGELAGALCTLTERSTTALCAVFLPLLILICFTHLRRPMAHSCSNVHEDLGPSFTALF